jgi:hypothetical protein
VDATGAGSSWTDIVTASFTALLALTALVAGFVAIRQFRFLDAAVSFRYRFPSSTLLLPDAPLNPLPRVIFFVCLGLGKALGQTVPDIPKDTDMKGADAVTMIREMFFQVFPGLQSK